MKRILALVLALTMMLGLAAAEEISYVGTWELTGITMAGMEVEPATVGLDAVIYINEDGSCVLLTQSEEGSASQGGTWVATEAGVTLTDTAGDTMELTYADGTLAMLDEEMTMVFTQADYPQVLSGLKMEDFYGAWMLSFIETGDGVFGADEVNMYAALGIQDSKAHMDIESDGVADSADAECELEEIDGFGTVLYVYFLDETTGQRDGNGLMLMRYNNGLLVWYAYDAETGEEAFYCFALEAEVGE